MSMLAGPKRKQKWTLNPRGKDWSADSNKFGQKMLEKMGWSSGKGLGAKEQGMVEHVRVKVKNDQVGIGYRKDQDDQWTEHQDDFNSFLQNLQKEQSASSAEVVENKVLSGKSLEEKSKLSTKRVHYKKFTRGKDVNKYSTKDLANIFGKKDFNEVQVKEEKEEEIEEEIYDPIGAKDTTAGILTIKGGNMNDYFKKRIPSSENAQEEYTHQNGNASGSESDKYTGFGFSVKSKSKFYVDENGDAGGDDSDSGTQNHAGFGFSKSSETKLKSKKQSNLNYVFDNPCLDLNILDDSPIAKKLPTNIELDNSDKITPRKRKNLCYDNIGLDLESQDKPTPKKRKNSFIYDNEGLDLQSQDRPTPKKQKSEFTYENEALDVEFQEKSIKVEENDEKSIKLEENNEISCDHINGSLQSTESSVKKKKKKKKTKSEPECNGIENPALDLDCPERTPSNKPRIISCEILSPGYDNAGLNLSILNRISPKNIKLENNYEIRASAYENPGLDLNLTNGETPKENGMEVMREIPIDSEIQELESETPRRKKNKKKKHALEYSNGFENPAMDLTQPTTETSSTTDFEVTRTNSGIENNALDLSDEESRSKRVTFNNQLEYNTDVSKKKKKKKQKLDKYEVESDQLKKKNKNPEPAMFVNEALDVDAMDEEEIENELNERKSKKSKRRRERRISLLETIEEAPEEEITVIEHSESAIVENANETENDIEPKKKNKKRKKKEKNIEETTENCEEAVIENTEVEAVEVVKKKKKKKKNKEIASDLSIENGHGPNELEKENNVTIKTEKNEPKDDDVISLEDFLNEENVPEKKPNKTENIKVEKPNEPTVIPKVEDDSNNYFENLRKTKQVMKSLFLKSPTLMFNGSNINEIKGYGSSLYNTYH